MKKITVKSKKTSDPVPELVVADPISGLVYCKHQNQAEGKCLDCNQVI